MVNIGSPDEAFKIVICRLPVWASADWNLLLLRILKFIRMRSLIMIKLKAKKLKAKS